MDNKDHEKIMVNLSAMPPSSFLSNYISTSPQLTKKVRYIVVNGNAKDFKLRVYRDSSKAPGYLSCDNYHFISFKQVGKVKKDKDIKYAPGPAPEGAIAYTIKGNLIYSMHELDQELINELSKIIKNKIT